jgi:hypothetical protein
MLRVSPRMHPSGYGGQESERTTMGNLTVAEKLAGNDELEELYKLNASEPDPEDDDEDEDEDEDDEEEGGGIKPEGMPQG